MRYKINAKIFSNYPQFSRRCSQGVKKLILYKQHQQLAFTRELSATRGKEIDPVFKMLIYLV
jgi:hypothetical protein